MKEQAKTTELALPPDDLLEEAAECLKVMGHPMRLKMVSILMQGEFAVHEIAELCGTTANQACEHLRLLKSYRFLSSQRRGRTVYYKILSPRLPRLIKCITTSLGS